MRTVVLSNGRLCVSFDQRGTVRELFFPVVGLLNHVRHGDGTRVFLWDGRWVPLFEEGDEVSARYEGGMVATWWRRGSKRSCPFELVQDAVDPYVPVWIRRFVVTDFSGDIVLVSLQRYTIAESLVGECAAWEPDSKRLYHYKGDVWIAHSIFPELTSGQASFPDGVRIRGVAAKVRDGGIRLVTGAPRVLGNSVDHGYVESAVGVAGSVRGPAYLNYIVALGTTKEEADRVMDEGMELGFTGISARSQRYWQRYLSKEAVTGRPAGQERTPPPPEDKSLEYLYNASVLIASAHWSEKGAIIASCDDDIMTDYWDHYRYVWPRDAAMIAGALLKCGLTEVARTYLEFAARCLHERGFFWQRYRPDGTRGSGWHPWLPAPSGLPIQADETAMTLLTAGTYLESTGDLDTLHNLYSRLVKPAAEFLCSYRSPDGRLVLPSYDLWEERRGIFAFTQAATAAGLWAAAKVADSLGIQGGGSFREAALDLIQGLLSGFSSAAEGIFRAAGDPSDDASLFLIPAVLTDSGIAQDERCPREKIWKALRETVTRAGGRLLSSGGMARYPGDWYWRQEGFDYPGNPWVVTTAWYLQSKLALGLLRPEDMIPGCITSPCSQTPEQGTRELPVTMNWFSKIASSSGALPEQAEPHTLKPLSVMPLAWSHACFLDLVNRVKPAPAFAGARSN